MRRLSARQLELLRLLPPYLSCRWHSGTIERVLHIGARRFSPATFNALVERGLAWGVDHSYGRISVGRLPAAEPLLAEPAES